MQTSELTLNQILWLSIAIKDKCPYCNQDIEIKPDDMGYRMGVITKDKDGAIVKNEPGTYFAPCPNCNKRINIAVFTEFSKHKE